MVKQLLTRLPSPYCLQDAISDVWHTWQIKEVTYNLAMRYFGLNLDFKFYRMHHGEYSDELFTLISFSPTKEHACWPPLHRYTTCRIPLRTKKLRDLCRGLTIEEQNSLPAFFSKGWEEVGEVIEAPLLWASSRLDSSFSFNIRWSELIDLPGIKKRTACRRSTIYRWRLVSKTKAWSSWSILGKRQCLIICFGE